MKSLTLCATILHIVALRLVSSLAASSGAQPAPIQPQLLNQVRKAMATTTRSSNNITQAYDACEQWNIIVARSDELPETVRGICFALQASCRSRVGQDTLALDSYDSCLNLKHQISKETLHDATMGKAFALQRLMRYKEACIAFLDCETEQACIGAVTCLLRQCDAKGAEKVLCDFSNRYPDSLEVKGMLGVLLYAQATTPNDVCKAVELLRQSRNKSPLYQWTYWISHMQKGDEPITSSLNESFDFLDVASVNQSPFDDPFLLHLDDKVFLHDLLTSKSNTKPFWPQGFVLPRDSSLFQECVSKRAGTDEKEWILKQRAGYGSHGNELVSKEQVLERLEKHSVSSDLFLCQRLVSPPLLLKGFKFTMRIYVVYFQASEPEQGCQVYIAKQGLVKFASLAFDDVAAIDDDRIHMTNSGREDQMEQCDLTVLEREFEQSGWSYRDFRNDIENATTKVMDACFKFAQEQHSPTQYMGKLGIPKILGLDFIVNASRRPFLLEVNRFPGLEPRDESDSVIKTSVVHGAWTLAATRMGLNMQEFSHFVDTDIEPCSFERLL